MRSSVAVSLLLASSMSIFGIYGRQRNNPGLPPGPEPVWVNGQQGVYHPYTGEFIPITSPRFDETCDLIQQQRAGANGATRPYYSHSNTYSGSHGWTGNHDVSGGSGYSSASDGSFGSGTHSSSVRGGIGGTGHAVGGGS